MKDTLAADALAKASADRLKLSPLKGLAVLACVVGVIATFVALHVASGLAEGWPAFLFLLVWAGLERMKFDRLGACLCGALLGLGVAYAMQALPQLYGPTGHAVPLAAILLLIYFQIMGWLPVLVNMATMLFLTVGTIQAIQAGAHFPGLFASLAAGCVYFAGLAALVQALMRRHSARQSDS
jgi:hypothetical protein